MELTVEQKEFIQKAKEGKNILVNACIGSGKTTAIQELCKEIPKEKKILYLTYNKLLKIDAKSKIKQKNVLVTNYHGFAYMALKGVKISVGVSDLIQTYNKRKPPISKYDILILDEYQDINSELSDLLLTIKDVNPNIQIIAVGDMDQKIYDFSKLNISEFINTFLGDYIKMEFTQCFRLPEEYAKELGTLWNKKITGVNKNCQIKIMSTEEIVHFLGTKKPKDILCLGARAGSLSKTLNAVEERYPQIYNKKTVYASISDNDAEKQISPSSNTAIFTTYDSSKGLERDVCIIFDYTEEYWEVRAKYTNRYQAIGNSWAIPTVQWLGKRIQSPANISLQELTPTKSDDNMEYYDFNKGIIQLSPTEYLNCSLKPENCKFGDMRKIITETVSKKLFISSVGCKGILRRAKTRNQIVNQRLKKYLVEGTNFDKNNIEK